MTEELMVYNRNLLLKSSSTIILFFFLIYLPVYSSSTVFSSISDDDNIDNSIQSDSRNNVITSQNTGNSNDNPNADDQILQEQELNSNLSSNEDFSSEDTVSAQSEINQPEQQQQQTVGIEMHPSCGQVVQGSVKLTSNLICKSDGIIVGANNTVIDMNGYSLKGPGVNSNKVGIMVGGQNNVTIIGNGIITGFQSGIYISGSNDISSQNINLNSNEVAFYITGSRNSEISNNMVTNNTIGVAVHSADSAKIKYNQLNQNELSGITLINTVNSLINGNNILNTTNGIFMDTQSSFNNVDFNNVFNNTLDINNANNLPININNNYYSNNNCITSLPSGLCIGR